MMFHVPLASALLLTTLVMTAAAAEPFTAEAWYRFEDADDLTGNVGSHPLPAALPERGCRQTDGVVGKALLLDGHNGHALQIPDPWRFFGREARAGTIALWVRPSFDPATDDREQVLFDFMSSRSRGNTRIDAHEIVAVVTGGKLRVQAQIGRAVRLDCPFKQHTWTHLVLTWDVAEGGAVYVDGKPVGNLAPDFKPVPLDWFAGWVGAHKGGGRPFAGSIDEVRLINRMLQPEEIAPLLASPPEVDVAVTRLDDAGAVVTNRGDADVPVRLCVYRPDTAMLAAGPPTTLPTGQTLWIPRPERPGTLGPETIRVVAGAGLTARATAAIERHGLELRLTDSRRVFFADETIPISFTLQNDCGRDFAGTLTVNLAATGEPLRRTGPAQPLEMSMDTSGTVNLGPLGPLSPGRWLLNIAARPGAGRTQTVFEQTLLVTSRETYRDIFAVSTTFQRKTEENYRRARADGVTILREGSGYSPDMGDYDRLSDVLGALGLKFFPSLHPFRAPPVDLSLPETKASGRGPCLSSPAVLDAIRGMAVTTATYLRDNPLVPAIFVDGEYPYAPPDYSAASTRAWQSWLADRYGTIAALNDAWGSQYADWTAIQQIGSPADVDDAAARFEWMKPELMKSTSARFAALCRQDPTRAIEWRRWHQGVIDSARRSFSDTFYAHNTVTGLATNPCWPNFHPHILFGYDELYNMAGIDPYLPGTLPQDLGYPSELLESIDMTVSIFQDRPLFVNELYVLSTYPAGVPEAQGWFLVGRGCNVMCYFTYDYYNEGKRHGKPLDFGLFDKEGKPYATYPSFRQFTRDAVAFHQRFDVNSLRRERPRVAIYLADANSAAGWVETGGNTWSATAVHAHIGAYWLTRQCGYPVEFVNGATWDRAEDAKVLIVPWTDLAGDDDLERILAFARRGGTVVLDGAVGLHDALYRPRPVLPGGEVFSAALGVRYESYQRTAEQVVVDPAGNGDQAIPALGQAVNPRVTDADIILRDSAGNPALLRRRLGRGTVWTFLSNIGRRQRGNLPDAEALARWRATLATAGLRPRAHIEATEPVGDPMPARDVALRLKGDREAFVFVTSFLGPTRGNLRLNLPRGDYRAVEARTDDPLSLTRQPDGTWSVPLDLPAFGTAVIRITADRTAFAAW